MVQFGFFAFVNLLFQSHGGEFDLKKPSLSRTMDAIDAIDTKNANKSAKGPLVSLNLGKMGALTERLIKHGTRLKILEEAENQALAEN